MNGNAICTIVALNYFAQAKSLMESVKKYHEDVDLYVLIVDKIEDEMVKARIVSDSESLMTINFVSDLDIENVESMAFKYDLVEFNTAVKPYYLEKLLNDKGYDSIIYLDSDILLFSPLSKIYSLLESNSIIITPHLISGEEDVDSEMSKIDDFLQYGVYNLGFIAVKNDCNGNKLLTWWKDKLSTKCFLSSEDFLAWDQKWMDFTPALFESVYVLKDPGHNVAFWNIQKRFISKENNEFYVNGTSKLVFYHFSHHRLTRPEVIADLEQEERCIRVSTRADLVELFNCYYDNVIRNNFNYYSKIKYGFSKYDNGKQIEKTHRRIYNQKASKGELINNPFSYSHDNSFDNVVSNRKLELSING